MKLRQNGLVASFYFSLESRQIDGWLARDSTSFLLPPFDCVKRLNRPSIYFRGASVSSAYRVACDLSCSIFSLFSLFFSFGFFSLRLFDFDLLATGFSSTESTWRFGREVDVGFYRSRLMAKLLRLNRFNPRRSFVGEHVPTLI